MICYVGLVNISIVLLLIFLNNFRKYYVYIFIYIKVVDNLFFYNYIIKLRVGGLFFDFKFYYFFMRIFGFFMYKNFVLLIKWLFKKIVIISFLIWKS